MQSQIDTTQNASFLNTTNSGPVSLPSGQSVKNLYKNELFQQMDQRKQKEFQEKQFDRHQDVKMLVGNQMNDWFGRQGNGAPVRDHQGNIQTSRKNPMNPNYQGQNWFGGQAYVAQNQQQQFQQQQLPLYTDNDQNQYGQNYPQQQQMTQQQLPPTRQMQNRSMINLPNINVQSMQQMPTMQTIQSMQNLKTQQALQGMLSQSQMITKPPVDDIQELYKRQRQLELQRELQTQMQDKQRRKEDDKYNIKRDRELEDQRIEREREQIKRRQIEDLGQINLESRNLHQSNFDGDGMNAQKRLLMLKYQNELLEQQNRKNTQHDNKKRIRSPVNDVSLSPRNRIDMRGMQQIPDDLERTVKQTINFELQRLRSEMHLQTNSVAEQLVQLKGQILRSDESKHWNDEQVRRLRDELKQTQVIDEIRQRELYQAFMGSQKNQLLFVDGTDRLITPDTFDGFNFPKRPRPYYNMADPYFGNQDEVYKDVHNILHDSTQMIPMSKDNNDWISLTNKNHTKEFDHNDVLNLGKKMDAEVDLPEDYFNRQKLYIPKRQMMSTNKYEYIDTPNDYLGQEYIQNQNNRAYKDDIVSIIGTSNQQYVIEEDEIKDVLRRYEEKYQQLDKIDAMQGSSQFERRDDALFDLIQQQTSKYDSKDTPKPYEYNDYYSDHNDEHYFNSKLGSIYSK